MALHARCRATASVAMASPSSDERGAEGPPGAGVVATTAAVGRNVVVESAKRLVLQRLRATR